ncbi:hypothetical protein [Peribacillus deserti]|uniref:Uncharacterized protein n=1 Tax=Peribacillus deserti TaxID=673318 RepID=A0A2N5M7X9_9BACI|nr:hypothetical protein [Peribacillus deserti]PLT30456.1 hypothetical protein CUU66_07275 [Peribacillus deserti]
MKIFQLKKDYKDLYKKGVQFFLISESEFIGVKEYTLLASNQKGKLLVSDDELNRYFFLKNP